MTNTFLVRGSNGDPVQFALVGMDHAGNQVHFDMALWFIPLGAAIDPAEVHQDLALGGQSLTIAPPGPAPLGSTRVTVHGFGIGAVAAQHTDPSLLPAGFTAPVLPMVDYLEVALDAASQFSGQVQRVHARMHPTYLAAGLDPAANPLGAFLDLPPEFNVPAEPGLPSPLHLPFSARDVGGLAKPDMTLGAVTALKGALPKGFELNQGPDPDQFQKSGDRRVGLAADDAVDGHP